MKKFFLYPFLTLSGLILTCLLAVGIILYFNPLLIVNPSNLHRLLERTEVLKDWSWDHAVIEHEKVRWNKRRWKISFKKFCFEYENSSLLLDGCLDNLSMDLTSIYTWEKGLRLNYEVPLLINSSGMEVTLKDSPKTPQKNQTPPDIWHYWQLLWHDDVPPMDLNFKSIVLNQNGSKRKIDFSLVRSSDHLEARSGIIKLRASPEQMVLTLPPELQLPDKLGFGSPLALKGVNLTARMREGGIPLILKGSLEALSFHVESFVELPLAHDPASVQFRKELMLKTSARVTLNDVRRNLKSFGPSSMKILPAPFNVLNGIIKMDVNAQEGEQDDEIMVKAETFIDLKGPKQFLQLDVMTKVDLNVDRFSLGPMTVGMDFRKVALQLPRFSKKELPPQLFPDGRIKIEKTPPPSDRQAEETRPLVLNLRAHGAEALQIMSNLLDEPLRLNLDLLINDASIEDGRVSVLPFRTTVFKRPVFIPDMRVTFNPPLEPVLEGQVIFPLPEYKIILSLKGPLSNPSHSLSSMPPLPQDDIYAVLLFGRPMSELNPDDSNAAAKTNQLLSQGILSLSVLYFFAGSRLEYVGLDPESGEGRAQIGLDSKSSLTLGGSGSGLRSTSVRRSLGKGWYLDTSVQNTNGTSSNQERAYGVLLERIIAY